MENHGLKIMYVDGSTDGHRGIYLNALLCDAGDQSFAVLPEEKLGQTIDGRCRRIPELNFRKFTEYRNWLRTLQRIADEEQPDVIHFLDGDSIMRYFGAGFGLLKKFRLVMTFHHFFEGKLRAISMRNMVRQMEMAVFHTEEIVEKARALGCKKVCCIPYPCFLDTPSMPGVGVKQEPPVLLALGGTRHDKGLDILLEALRMVEKRFHLLIAGREVDFGKAFIEQKIAPYRESVELKLYRLSDEEMLDCLKRSDIIVLPYRKVFDGASGPMCEGVYLGKMILGPEHGSLGQLIQEQHVGYTFESENPESLAAQITQALESDFSYDAIARKAQDELLVERFLERYSRLYRKICK